MPSKQEAISNLCVGGSWSNPNFDRVVIMYKYCTRAVERIRVSHQPLVAKGVGGGDVMGPLVREA